jgi:hypothetical protein
MRLIRRFFRWFGMKDEDPEQIMAAEEVRREHETHKTATFDSPMMRGRDLPRQ